MGFGVGVKPPRFFAQGRRFRRRRFFALVPESASAEGFLLL